jgi:hypothetical protein
MDRPCYKKENIFVSRDCLGKGGTSGDHKTLPFLFMIRQVGLHMSCHVNMVLFGPWRHPDHAALLLLVCWSRQRCLPA